MPRWKIYIGQLLGTKKDEAQSNYVPGVVLVTFKDGTTYREAKDYLKSLGYEIEGRNSYWTASNFKPVDSTVLKTVDIFEIKVSEGKENEAIAEVLKSPLVRVAEKNFIITIPDCSKGPC
ncbi:hypothetical protein HY357_01300 [Candidatus Roizmanbacteria bacterium]|nr:hypothetical protein [Candidatus Roizmanbacteria bacterium]